MQPIRMSIRAADAATTAELRRELEALQGQEPAGAELLEDRTPRPQLADPLLTSALIALVGGIAGGAGKGLAETLMGWLLERIREVAKRRKTTVIVTLGETSLEIDERTRVSEAATLAAALLKMS
jgi:hypothetical protein